MPVSFNPDTRQAYALSRDGQWQDAPYAANPDTGEQFIFDGNQWQSIGTIQQNSLGGAVRAGIQGATAGFGARAMSAIDAALGFSGDTPIDQGTGTLDNLIGEYEGDFASRYAGSLDRRQRQLSNFAHTNPVTSGVANIGGAIVSPINKVTGGMLQAPTMLSKAMRGAAVGAGEGALYSAGNTKDLTDLSQLGKDVQSGAAFGAAFGAASPAMLEGAKAIYRNTLQGLFDRIPYRQEGVAARKIAEALERDGYTSEQQIINRLQEIGQNAVLGDLGPNVRGVVRALHSLPGKGKKQVDEFLQKRQEGVPNPSTGMQSGAQYNRVLGIIKDLEPQSYKEGQRLTREARKQYGDDYNAARAIPGDVDILPVIRQLAIEGLDAKGTIKSGLSDIRKLLFNSSGKPETSISALHQAKMAIDDMMTPEARSSIGRVTKARIREYQNKLIDAIEASPGGENYRRARLGTAAQWRIDEALDEGRNFMLKSHFKDISDVKDYLSAANAQERDAFKVGAAQWLKEQIEGTKYSANAVKNLIGNPSIEHKMVQIFGANKFKKFKNTIAGEGEMYGTYATARGGSPTARIEAEKADITQDPSRVAMALRDLLTGQGAGHVGGLANLLSAGAQRWQLPDEVGGRMAQMLTGRDTAPLRNQPVNIPQLNDQRAGKLAAQLISAYSEMRQ